MNAIPPMTNPLDQMRTHSNMNDAQRIATWNSITDLHEAVAEFLEHRSFIGSDEYYSHLDQALWDMLERCYKRKTEKKTPK